MRMGRPNLLIYKESYVLYILTQRKRRKKMHFDLTIVALIDIFKLRSTFGKFAINTCNFKYEFKDIFSLADKSVYI